MRSSSRSYRLGFRHHTCMRLPSHRASAGWIKKSQSGIDRTASKQSDKLAIWSIFGRWHAAIGRTKVSAGLSLCAGLPLHVDHRETERTTPAPPLSRLGDRSDLCLGMFCRYDIRGVLLGDRFIKPMGSEGRAHRFKYRRMQKGLRIGGVGVRSEGRNRHGCVGRRGMSRASETKK